MYEISVNLKNFKFWDQICQKKHFRVEYLDKRNPRITYFKQKILQYGGFKWF